jgi:hypothetical protein
MRAKVQTGGVGARVGSGPRPDWSDCVVEAAASLGVAGATVADEDGVGGSAVGVAVDASAAPAIAGAEGRSAERRTTVVTVANAPTTSSATAPVSTRLGQRRCAVVVGVASGSRIACSSMRLLVK